MKNKSVFDLLNYTRKYEALVAFYNMTHDEFDLCIHASIHSKQNISEFYIYINDSKNIVFKWRDIELVDKLYYVLFNLEKKFKPAIFKEILKDFLNRLNRADPYKIIREEHIRPALENVLFYYFYTYQNDHLLSFNSISDKKLMVSNLFEKNDSYDYGMDVLFYCLLFSQDTKQSGFTVNYSQITDFRGNFLFILKNPLYSMSSHEKIELLEKYDSILKITLP